MKYPPHFYAHIISSISLLIAIWILIANYNKLKYADLIQIFAVLSIAIAAHGQGHTTLEKEYGI
jgi:hypothetical protein